MPKLELSAAYILAKLITKVKSSLSVNIDSIHYWDDSTIALNWIRFEHHRLQTFVCNRVTDIQAQSPPESWKHISSSNNPADLLSRGVAPKTLVELRL